MQISPKMNSEVVLSIIMLMSLASPSILACSLSYEIIDSFGQQTTHMTVGSTIIVDCKGCGNDSTLTSNEAIDTPSINLFDQVVNSTAANDTRWQASITVPLDQFLDATDEDRFRYFCRRSSTSAGTGRLEFRNIFCSDPHKTAQCAINGQWCVYNKQSPKNPVCEGKKSESLYGCRFKPLSRQAQTLRLDFNSACLTDGTKVLQDAKLLCNMSDIDRNSDIVSYKGSQVPFCYATNQFSGEDGKGISANDVITRTDDRNVSLKFGTNLNIHPKCVLRFQHSTNNVNLSWTSFTDQLGQLFYNLTIPPYETYKDEDVKKTGLAHLNCALEQGSHKLYRLTAYVFMQPLVYNDGSVVNISITSPADVNCSSENTPYEVTCKAQSNFTGLVVTNVTLEHPGSEPKTQHCLEDRGCSAVLKTTTKEEMNFTCKAHAMIIVDGLFAYENRLGTFRVNETFTLQPCPTTTTPTTTATTTTSTEAATTMPSTGGGVGGSESTTSSGPTTSASEAELTTALPGKSEPSEDKASDHTVVIVAVVVVLLLIGAAVGLTVFFLLRRRRKRREAQKEAEEKEAARKEEKAREKEEREAEKAREKEERLREMQELRRQEKEKEAETLAAEKAHLDECMKKFLEGCREDEISSVAKGPEKPSGNFTDMEEEEENFRATEDVMLPDKCKPPVSSRYCNIPIVLGTRPKGINFHCNKVETFDGKDLAIACNAPTPAQYQEFYKMICQERPAAIVAIASKDDIDQLKVHEYWNDFDKTDGVRCEGRRIKTTYSVKLHYGNGKEEVGVCRYLNISEASQGKTDSAKEKTEFQSCHIRFTSWTDSSKLGSISLLLTLVDTIKKVLEGAKNCNAQKLFVLHCSAGIGRSGVLLVCMEAIRMLEEFGKTSVWGLIKFDRKFRFGIVQTRTQYEEIIDLIKQYISRMKLGNLVANASQKAPPPPETEHSAIKRLSDCDDVLSDDE